MLNLQPPEKRVVSNGRLLDVHSIFHTIQGEGPFCGTPAIFIRLAGCNLQCPLCDTDYTSKRVALSPAQICQEANRLIQNTKTTLVVITGGEPFRQALGPLLRMLVEIGYFVQIETNGTFNPPEDIEYSCATDERKGVYIVCSPKAGKVRTMIHECACCYKYVGSAGNLDKDDGLPIWPLEHPSNGRVARPENEMIPVYLQPTDHKDPVKNLANREAVILSCLKHGYILQLQVHKIIDME